MAEIYPEERARMQAQAVLYLCSVPYLIATEIAATRQKGKGKKEGRKIRSNQRHKKNKPLWPRRV